MSSSPLQSTRPPLSLLLSIALLSAALLSFEIALTRVFAVVLRYHFAFLVISVALCGLGIGGYAAHGLRARRPLSLPVLAALFAISIDIALLLMLRGVFAIAPEAWWLAALVVLGPFCVGGAFLAEAFARWPKWSGRLYAWDLAGAALAAAGTIAILQMMSAMSACALAAVAASISALLLIEPHAPRRARWPALVPLALMAIWLVDARWKIFEVPPLPPKPNAEGLTLADRGITQSLFTELGTPGHRSRILETRWNAFARTDVVDDPDSPNSYLLYTNGNVPTNMMNWDGKLATIGPIAEAFPLSDWAFAVAPLGAPSSTQRGTRPAGKVLSIGPGGGLDALLALRHNAERFDGAEINPSIIDIMRDYARYNGGIYTRPEIHIAIADGRAWSREALQRGQKYELVFSALTKTATAGQGMALLESFIHTTNAFDDYWQLMQPNGQATMLLDNPVLMARFVATWLAVMQRRGIDNKTAMKHIALVNDSNPGPYQFAVVVQKTPFTRAQNAALSDAALQRHLTPIWIDTQAGLYSYGNYPKLADGSMRLNDFVADFRKLKTPLDISPCPDNRPFVLDLNPSILPQFTKLTWGVAALALILTALGFVTQRRSIDDLDGVQTPLNPFKSAQEASQSTAEVAQSTAGPLPDALQSTVGRATISSSAFDARDVGWILYFLCLGVGFIMIEIPLAQKLILPLGYPTLALSVILFSVLLGGGLGSWFSQRFEGDKLRRWAMICALGVAICGAGSTFLLDQATAALPPMSLTARCIAAALFLLPLGFLLGAPFPSGMRLFAARRAQHIPLVWGLNGIASVFGSLCAAMIAKSSGFDRALLGGVSIYLLAALLLALLSESKRP